MAMVDRPPGYEDYDDGHRHLVDLWGMATRMVGVVGGTEDEGRGMGGVEVWCDFRVMGLRMASLRGFESPSCW